MEATFSFSIFEFLISIFIDLVFHSRPWSLLLLYILLCAPLPHCFCLPSFYFPLILLSVDFLLSVLDIRFCSILHPFLTVFRILTPARCLIFSSFYSFYSCSIRIRFDASTHPQFCVHAIKFLPLVLVSFVCSTRFPLFYLFKLLNEKKINHFSENI